MINIVLLNWNEVEYIKKTLVRLNKVRSSEDFRVVVINNNPKYKVKEFIRIKNYKYQLHLIESKVNLGYAGGNNLIVNYLVDMKLDGGVFILNPDVEFDENIIARLIENVKSYDLFMFSARDNKGEVLYNNITMNGMRQSWHKNNLNVGYVTTDYLAGSCFYISREYLLITNLFDELFFLYWEEVDLSLRLRLLNEKLFSDTDFYVIRNQNPNISIINSQFYLARNAFYLYYKHGDNISIFNFLYYLILSLLTCLYKSIKWKSILPLKMYVKGMVEGIIWLWKCWL